MQWGRVRGWLTGMPVFPDDVPELADGRVTLRAHRADDVPRLVQFANDPLSRRGVRLPDPYGEAEGHAFLQTVQDGWQHGGSRQWAIEVDGLFVGSIGLHHPTAVSVEIGYGLHPDARGRGVLTAAARLLLEQVVVPSGIRTVQWRAARGNWGSRRVAWALGVRVDGTWPAGHPATDGDPDDLWFGHLDVADWTGSPAHPWHVPAALGQDDDLVRLRAWREDDAPTNEPDTALRRFMLGSAPTPAGFAEWLLARRERMADGEAVVWCIADARTDEALGGIQLHRMNQRALGASAQLAYWLHPAARGRGLVQRALEHLIEHAFTPAAAGGLGLRRIGAGTDAANVASAAVLLGAGFRQTGAGRQVLTYDDGSIGDETSFELLVTDEREAARRRARPTPVLRTDRLVLRPWSAADAPDSDPEPDAAAAATMGSEPRPPRTDFEAWLARVRTRALDGTSVRWCITDAQTDRPLGSISVRGLGEPTRSGTIGYWLYPAARGHGYTSEALRAVVDHAFSSEGLAVDRLAGETVAGNHASMLTLADAGFRQWGEDHGSFVTADGTVRDSAYFELLRSEYEGGETI